MLPSLNKVFIIIIANARKLQDISSDFKITYEEVNKWGKQHDLVCVETVVFRRYKSSKQRNDFS